MSHANPFYRSGSRIWNKFATIQVVLFVKRFCQNAPNNEAENIIFTAVRDLWDLFLRKVSWREPGPIPSDR